MKKIVGLLAAAVLAFNMSAPAFAVTDSYLADKIVYFNADFEKYNEGALTKLDEGANIALAINKQATPEIATDTEKDSKVLKFTPAEEWSGITIKNVNDVAAGEKLFYELSVKAMDYSVVNFQALSSFRLFTMSSGGKTKKMCLFNESQELSEYNLGQWYHIVMEIEPTDATGYLTVFLNNEKVFARKPNSNLKLASVNACTRNRLQLNGSEASEFYIDDFRCWKSAASYDPDAAGDTAKISTDLTVAGDMIYFADGAMLSQIGAQNGGSVRFYAADGAEITDTAAQLAEGTKIVITSASGVSRATYTAKKTPLTSSAYTVDPVAKTISGVPYMTDIESFKANLAAADGVELSVTSANGYADSATVVTVDGAAYTVENALWYAQNFENVSSFGALSPYFVSSGSSKASAGFAGTDDIKNSKALKETFSAVGGLHHFSYAGMITEPINDGDIVNLELSFRADGYNASQIWIAGMRVLSLTETGSMKTFNETVTLAEKYVPGEWNHLVVSFGKRNYTEVSGDISQTYSTVKLYLNGKQLLNPNRGDAIFPNTGFNTDGLYRITLACGSKTADPVWLDDIRVYKAATQDYDEAYMLGKCGVSSENYIISDRVIYLEDVENDVADAVNSLRVVGGNPVDKYGDVINPDDMDKDSVFYIVDPNGVRVMRYSFAPANTLTESADFISGALYGEGMLILASYDEDGTLARVRLTKLDTEKATVSARSFGTKAFLWNNNLKPMSMLEKGEDGEWK